MVERDPRGEQAMGAERMPSGLDDAERPVVRVELVEESGRPSRTVRECTASAHAPAAASAIAAAVSAAARHARSIDTADERPQDRRGRPSAWTVAGRLDAVGLEGLQRLRVGARSRAMQTFQVRIDGRIYEVTVEDVGRAAPPPSKGWPGHAGSPASAAHAPRAAARSIRAPIPGKILAVNVGPAERVTSSTVLLVLEAMKMENDVLAPSEGTVTAVHVRPGDTVRAGDVMVVIE